MREITYLETLRETLKEIMHEDETTFLMGEDVGEQFGGPWKTTQGLGEEFGDERVRDTPISELAMAGIGIGAAMTGMRPIIEYQFSDLLALAMDQICNLAAKIRYMSGGQINIPLIIRTPIGGGIRFGAVHSQSLEAWFMHMPGLKVVLPSTPYDLKGLLKTAVSDGNPVMFFEHKMLYPLKGRVPDTSYFIPFGEADIKRHGKDVTAIATSRMVHETLKAADILAKEIGIEVEVIDPRTLVPLDEEKITASIEKTHRAIIISEDCLTAGVSAEIAAVIAEKAFDSLDSPIRRLAEPNTPIPYSPPLENFLIPNAETIVETIKEVVS